MLIAEKITSLVPGIAPEWAQMYADAISATLAELAPSGVPESRSAQVLLLLVNAVRRAGQARPWVESEAVGPYQVKLRQVSDEIFTDDVLWRLRDLLGVAGAVDGVSRAEFPQPDDWGGLFVARGALRRHALGAEAPL